MNALKNFFLEDIPATFSAGKLRIALMQLNSRLAQLQKQKDAIVNELGAKAWEGRVKDERYSIVYGKLEELDFSASQVQQEIDNIQNSIDQETGHLNTITGDFNNRTKEIQDQRQPALQKLGEFQAEQKSIEQRLIQLQAKIAQGRANVQNMQTQVGQSQASAQPDKEAKVASLLSTITSVNAQIEEAAPQLDSASAELNTNQANQKPIRDQIEGYDQLIKMLQEQFRSAAAPIQEQIKDLQQSLVKVNQEKSEILGRITTLLPTLGGEVYKYHPLAEILSPVYAQLGVVENQIKGVNDEINLTNARLASIGSGSVKKVAIAGGLLVLLTVCIIALVTAVPTVATLFKPDPKASIHLVQSWSLENCVSGGSQGSYIDFSVWENRRTDSTANVNTETQLIGSNKIVLDSASYQFDIGPGGSAVSFMNLDPKGSRVQDVKHSISSVYFTKFELGRLPNVDVQTSFEKAQNSNNITLGLEITNKSDFGLTPDVSSTANTPFALVINDQNKLIDVLGGAFTDQTIGIDSMSKVTFQSAGYYLSGTCLQGDYSQIPVTFWYFVPLQVSTSSSDKITISGKARYTP